MNNLVLLMKARGITPEELSKMSGCNVGNIRRIMKLDSLDFVYKSTTEKLSKALGVTPRELVKGGKSMKKKILQTEVTRAAETLCNALRAYTDEPLYLRIAVFSRDKSVICDGDPDGVPDYYDVRVSEADFDPDNYDPIVSKSARVYYGEDGIRFVIPFKEIGDE